MTSDRAKLIAALVVTFVLVGVAAVASTIRLNVYIREMAPRDAAQQMCDAQTMEMMRLWMDVRSRRDIVERGRDDAVAKFLDETAETNEATPAQLGELRSAIDTYQKSWASGDLSFPETLPDCDGTP